MAGSRKPEEVSNPDQPELEKQGRMVFLMTMGAALAVVVVGAIIALLVLHVI